MFKFAFVSFFLLQVVWCKNVEITFKNVIFHGYSVYVHKFKKTIELSNSLAENLPNDVLYDKIEFTDQNIPALYRDSISDIEDLDELVIERCNLHEVRPGAFRKVSMLRRLSLADNNLQEIDEGVFNNLQISDLDLSKNKIKVISSSAFDDLPNILNIRLSDNKISSWDPKWFKNAPMLTRISMQNNLIESIPSRAFHNLGGIRKFGSVDLKINLVLSYNKIRSIDSSAFSGLQDINNLWLDNNLLEDFDDELLKNTAVKDLRINSNNIKCFTGDLKEVLKAENNHIDANPFECDCVEKIKKFAKENDKSIDVFYAEMDCIAKRIKIKMNELENRIKKIKEDEPEVRVSPSRKTSIEDAEWI